MFQPLRIFIYGLSTLFLLLSFRSDAATYFTRQSGNWNSPSTWSTAGYGGAAASSTPGSSPGDVVLLSGVTVTVTATPANNITAITISQNWNTGNDTRLYLSTAGTTLTTSSLSMIENNRSDDVAIEVSNGTFQVNGGASITRSTSNNQDDLLQLYIYNNGRMNITGSLTYTYGRAANNSDSGCEVLLEDNGRLDIGVNLTVTIGSSIGGNDSEFRFQMNDNSICNVGGNVSLALSNSNDGDDLIMDLNGGTFTVSGTYTGTVNNTCSSSNSCNLYIDGATMSTGAFTYTQSGGGSGDMSIFLNRNSTSAAASLTVTGAITYTHNDGDNMEIETNTNSTLTVTGAITSTVSSSSDGDVLYYDFNGGTVNANSMSAVIATGATSGNHFQFTVDGTTVNITNNLYISQNGGGSGDAYLYLNQNSTSTAAAVNVGGNFIFTHTGGDNMEIETNTNSTITVTGNLTDTLTSTDGDIFYIDINGGTFQVNGNFTHYMSGGGNSEDLDIRIDGSGRFNVDGHVTIPQTTGDDVLILLNASSGTTAQFNIGGNFTYTHTGGDDFWIQMIGSSSVFTVGGYFTSTFTSSDGDQFVMDLDGGTFTVSSYFTHTQNGGGTSEDITITLDGSTNFTVGGAMTINQQSGDDGFLLLNNASGTSAQLNIGGDFTYSHTGGDDFSLQVNATGSSLAIGGNFSNTWTSNDGDIYITDINNGLLSVGGSTTYNQTASGGTTEDIFIYIDGSGRMSTTGAFTFTHSAGNDFRIYLNNTSGTTAQFTVGTNLTINHVNGDDVTILLNASGNVFSVGGNFSETWTSSDGDNHLIDINGGTLSVGGSYTWNQTASGGTTEQFYIYIDGAGRMTTAGSFTVTHAAGDDVLIYLNNTSGTTAQFTVGTDLTFTHTNGDDFAILMNGASNVVTIGGNFTNTWTSADGDYYLLDINGGVLTVGGNYSMTQTASGGTTENFHVYIDGSGRMNTTGSFTVTHAAGDDVLIYLNNTSGTNAQFTVGSDMTINHTSGDDFILRLNAASSVATIGGNFSTTWTSADADLYYIDINGGVLTVGGGYSVTETASGGTGEDITLRLDGSGQMNVTGSFTITRSAGNDCTIFLNSASGTNSQLNIGGNFTLTHNAGDDAEIELNSSSTMTIGGSFTNTWTSSDGDVFDIDLNGNAILSVGTSMTIDQTASGGTNEYITIRIDDAARMNVGGSFTMTQAAGNDFTIFLNSASGTTAQMNIGGSFTMTHTAGDDFEMEINGTGSSITIGGSFNTTWTSNDGDQYYLDFNDGIVTVTGNVLVNQTASGGTTEDIFVRQDGANKFNIGGSLTFTQAAGNDVTVMLNTVTGTTAELNITGGLNVTHSGGDDFELETNGSSIVTVGGDLAVGWNSNDGDDCFIDLNGGRFSVAGGFSYSQPAPGGTTEDLDIRLDGSARMDVTGTTNISQQAGGQIIFYLNNFGGTTAQFNGGNFNINHGTAAAGTYVELNGSSTFTLTGYFNVDNASSGNDLARFRMNGTPTVNIAGSYTMNQTAGSTAATDNVELDINGGTMTIGGTLTMNQTGGNDAILTVDGTGTILNVTGALSLTHTGGDDNYVTLGAASGSPTANLGSLSLNDNGGDITYFRLSNASIANITGSVTLTAAAQAQVDIALYNTSQLRIGGNFVRSATPNRFGILSCAAGSTVEYNGSSPQTIAGDAGSGTDAFTYANVRLNNASGYSMNSTEGNATIPSACTLTFSQGVVNSVSTGMMVIAAGASVTGASNSTYVDGPIRKVGNTAFTFPVGDLGNYQPIAISAPGNAAHHFTAQYIETDPNSPYTVTSKDASLHHISRCEYWILDRTNGASNVTATLAWDANSCGVDSLAALRVAQWDGSAWRDRGNASTSGNTTAGTITSNSLTSFASTAPITLASSTGNNWLPVELIRFEVKPENDRAQVMWSTASEKDNDYFNIERSEDGINFITIGQIKGAGTSHVTLNYAWNDLKPLRGISYYRLKQVDFNGKFEYSPIRSCYFKAGKEGKSFTLYPNPNTGTKVSVRFESAQELKQPILDVYDLKGIKIFSELPCEMDASGYNAVINMPESLPEGVYITSLKSGELFEKQILVIKK